jgi:uncharacterized protein (PEP-CTERM system associated)
VAINWIPNTRNLLQVGYRNRDVGLNPGGAWSGRFTHRTRRTQWDAVYEEGTTTTQELLATGNIVNLFDPATGEVILAPSAQPVFIDSDVFGLTDEVIERKQFKASIEIRTAKSTIAVRGFAEQREPQLTGDDERRIGTTVSWTWRLEPRTDSLLSSGWQHTTFAVDDRTDDLWYLQAGLTRRIRRSVNGLVYYRYTARMSDLEGDEYRENRVTLLVSKRF